MNRRKTWPCPVCKKPLTRKEYERALHIHTAQKEHLDHREQELIKRERRIPSQIAEAKTKGREEQERKDKRLMAGLGRKLEIANDRIRQLEEGTTPQTEGLELEDELARRLGREFKDDQINQTRKGGDVLHRVRTTDLAEVGSIIYECKRYKTLKAAHIRQAFRAKQQRRAVWAVIVTTARRGFTGLCERGGVLCVAPLGVIALTSLLRNHLLEMHRANVSQSERALIADQLVRLIGSPEFKNPIEEVIRRATDLQASLHNEA